MKFRKNVFIVPCFCIFSFFILFYLFYLFIKTFFYFLTWAPPIFFTVDKFFICTVSMWFTEKSCKSRNSVSVASPIKWTKCQYLYIILLLTPTLSFFRNIHWIQNHRWFSWHFLSFEYNAPRLLNKLFSNHCFFHFYQFFLI